MNQYNVRTSDKKLTLKISCIRSLCVFQDDTTQTYRNCLHVFLIYNRMPWAISAAQFYHLCTHREMKYSDNY